MLERLIENWLDSAGERSYQPCFSQMLTGKGYRILHNTEHTPLEFGKDMIAISPDQRLIGYQLKGNPGSTLKPREFEKMRGQLEQLATLALSIPGFEGKVPDECYLVTNGEIDEAVYHQLQLLNSSLEARGHPSEKIKTITRGTLLEWSKDLGLALWPSELEDFANLVELLNYKGEEIFPAKTFDSLLQHTLRLSQNVTSPELRRRITSAAIMTAVALRSFSRKQNHFAEITAWTMFSTYAIAACERNGLDFAKDGRGAGFTGRDTVYDLLGRLCTELPDRGTLAEGDPLSDFAFYRPRAILIYALMAIYWMWSEAEGWKQPSHKSIVEEFIPAHLPAKWLWGEAATAHFLTYTWYRKRMESSSAPDELVGLVLEALMGNKLAQAGHLASPYYDIEDVVRHQYADALRCEDPFGSDSLERHSYVCEGLMASLVHAKQKERCKELWPNFTRIDHESVVPDQSWRYCLFRMGEEATNATKIYPPTMKWPELQTIMSENAGAGIPATLKADPVLLLLFVNVFPFRASFSAVKFLLKNFDNALSPK